MAHIYKITNILNDKGYVGKTSKPPEKRWKEHLYCAKTDGPMVISRAIRKHGEKNFKFEVIEECSIEEMNSKETHWIDYYDTYNNGYNSSMGGEGSGLGVKRERGAVHPDAKSVDCYDLEGKYLCTYDSMGEAAYASGDRDKKGGSGIIACIKGTTFQAYGYRWALKGEPLKEVNNRINRRGKVYGVHLESGRKKMWESQADASEEINGDRKKNACIGWAIERNDQPDTTKTQVKGWYMFRDRKIALGDWKKAEPHTLTSERARELGGWNKGKSMPMHWKGVKGVNAATGEIVEFSHAGEAAEQLRSDFCIVSRSTINNSISKRRTRGIDSTAGGYRWFYVNEEEDLFESTVNGDSTETIEFIEKQYPVRIKSNKSRSEETKKKISEGMKKVHRTEEWKQNMSKGLKRKVELGEKWGFMNGNYDTSSHAKRKVKAIPVLNPTGNQKYFALSDKEMIFDSTSDAAKFFNGKTSCISAAIKHGFTSYGYKWEKIDLNPIKRKVYGVEKDTGQKTMIFESISDAGRFFGNNRKSGGLRKSLKAPGVNTYMKHYWYYVT